MALTPYQRNICRLLAARRRAAGESYVAGGVALNEALHAHRLSRDLDIFHDTAAAVARSWDDDRGTLEGHARRSSHYSAAEVAALAFDGPVPDAGELGRTWRSILDVADDIVEMLPADRVGDVVLSVDGRLFTGAPTELRRQLAEGQLMFHPGRLGGALPRVIA